MAEQFFGSTEYSIEEDASDWAFRARLSLERNGFVVIRGKRNLMGKVTTSQGKVDCARLGIEVADRVDRVLLPLVENQTKHEKKVEFHEICSRMDLSRFDVRLSYPQLVCTESSFPCEKVSGNFQEFHSVDVTLAKKYPFVLPNTELTQALFQETHDRIWAGVLAPLLAAVDNKLGGHEKTLIPSVDIAGCVVSRPGSSDQKFHQDGSRPGFFNVFVPLVDVTTELGPTEFVPGSHLQEERSKTMMCGANANSSDMCLGFEMGGNSSDENAAVAPPLGVGDLLIFDYRVRHRGLGNKGTHARPVAYLTYTKDAKTTDSFNFPKRSVYDVFVENEDHAEEIIQRSTLRHQRFICGGKNTSGNTSAADAPNETAETLSKKNIVGTHGTPGTVDNATSNIVDYGDSDKKDASECDECYALFTLESIDPSSILPNEQKSPGEPVLLSAEKNTLQDNLEIVREKSCSTGKDANEKERPLETGFWNQLRFENRSREMFGVENTDEYFVVPDVDACGSEPDARHYSVVEGADIYREVRGFGFASLPGRQVRQILNPQIVAVNRAAVKGFFPRNGMGEPGQRGTSRDDINEISLDILINSVSADELCGNNTAPIEPVAHCYAGFQYGSFAGQLGDGASVSLGEVIVCFGAGSDKSGGSGNGIKSVREISLKGCGLTPFTRHWNSGLDGRKSIAQMLREYIISGALETLDVSTTRGLALCVGEYDVKTASQVVLQNTCSDQAHTATACGNSASTRRLAPCATLLRDASTFLRFGSFEVTLAQQQGRPPAPSAYDYSMLRKLADRTIELCYPELMDDARFVDHTEEDDDLRVAPRYRELVLRVTKRTALMASKWQALGAVHGRLNTDNLSVAGETLNHATFAFCSGPFKRDFLGTAHARGVKKQDGTTDERYCFKNQPNAVLWGLNRFAEALQPLHCEPFPDFQDELSVEFHKSFAHYYFSEEMGRKLGLASETAVDSGALISLTEQLLALLESSQFDFTLFFRIVTGKVQQLVTKRKQSSLQVCKNQPVLERGKDRPLDKGERLLVDGREPLDDDKATDLRILQDMQKECAVSGECCLSDGLKREWNDWWVEYRRLLLSSIGKGDSVTNTGEVLIADADIVANIDEISELSLRVDMMKRKNPLIVPRDWLLERAEAAVREGDFREVQRIHTMFTDRAKVFGDAMDDSGVRALDGVDGGTRVSDWFSLEKLPEEAQMSKPLFPKLNAQQIGTHGERVIDMLSDAQYWDSLILCGDHRNEESVAPNTEPNCNDGCGRTMNHSLTQLQRKGYSVIPAATEIIKISNDMGEFFLRLTEKKLPATMIFACSEPWKLIRGYCLPLMRRLISTIETDSGGMLEVDLAALRLDVWSEASAASFSRFRRGYRADLSLADGTGQSHIPHVFDCSVDLRRAGGEEQSEGSREIDMHAIFVDSWRCIPARRDIGYVGGKLAPNLQLDMDLLQNVEPISTPPGSVLIRTHRLFCWRKKHDIEALSLDDVNDKGDTTHIGPVTLNFGFVHSKTASDFAFEQVVQCGVKPAIFRSDVPPLRFRVAFAAALCLLNDRNDGSLDGTVRTLLWQCFLAVSNDFFTPSFARQVFEAYAKGQSAES